MQPDRQYFHFHYSCYIQKYWKKYIQNVNVAYHYMAGESLYFFLSLGIDCPPLWLQDSIFQSVFHFISFEPIKNSMAINTEQWHLTHGPF